MDPLKWAALWMAGCVVSGSVAVDSAPVSGSTTTPGVTGTVDTEDTIETTGTAGTPGTTVDTLSPCFEDDIVPVLERTCGASDVACHTAEMYHPSPENNCYGWLSLENRPLGSIHPTTLEPTGCPDLDLYDRLTQLGAWQCYVNGWAANGNTPAVVPYVVPGVTAESYLEWKIDPEGVLCDSPVGTPSERMPVGGEIGASELALIRAWIGQGAVRCDATPTTTTEPVGNEVPVVEIWHPGDGEVRSLANGAFLFQGHAEDVEDGELTADLEWLDNGVRFGSGTGFNALPAGVGVHVISAQVTDASGATGSASIEITMVP